MNGLGPLAPEDVQFYIGSFDAVLTDAGNGNGNGNGPEVIPAPPALPLLASALLGVGFIGWRRSRAG